MNTVHLEYFLKLADTMNYASAAEQLNISQSGLYSAIAALEKELDLPLFEKRGRNIVLSTYGEVFRKYAKRTIDDKKKTLHEISVLKKTQSFPINVAVSIGYNFAMFSQIIKEYSQVYSNSVNITQKELPLIIESLLSKQIIFGFSCITDLVLDDENLAYYPIMKEECRCFVHRDNPLASHKSIRFAELHNETFIVYSEYTRKRYGQKMNDYGYEFKNYPGILHKDTIFSFVGNNMGVCICGAGLAPENKNIVSIALEDDFNEHNYGIIWMKNIELPDYAQGFLDFVKDYTNKNYSVV